MVAERALDLGAIVFILVLSPAMADGNSCPRGSMAESIIGRGDLCSTSDSPATSRGSMGIVEGDELALQKALYLVHTKEEDYVALLFHSIWCPFSKMCYPNFGLLSSMFPTIPHFSFEESVIRPSVLSRYGVHGFPTLFLMNSTMRVRYHGSRAINSLVSFYSDVTGIQASPLGQSPPEKTATEASSPAEPGAVKGQDNCPISWARSPEKMLQQDTYLALASSFLVLRLLHCILPKVNACGLCALWHHVRRASFRTLWGGIRRGGMQVFGRINHGKRR